MIEKIDNYKYPTKAEIDDACFNMDYNFYVPEKLFEDLLSLYCYNYHKLDIKWSSFLDNEFNKNYKEFLLSINFDNYNGYTPLTKCINILKELQKSINFRSLEKQEIEFKKERALNFKEDISVEDYLEVKELFKINDEKFAEIINLTSNIKSSLNFKNSETLNIKNTRAKNLKDVFLKNKSFLLKPNFITKLYEKSFYVDKEVEISNTSEVLIIIEDSSKSMKENIDIINFVRYCALNFYGEVHLYRITKEIIDYKVLKNKQDKLDYFKIPLNFKSGDCDYSLIKKILKEFKEGNCIVATDGDNFVPTIYTKVKVNCVSNKLNVNLKNLTKKTKGKYIMI
jgi:hypothetical protein